MRRNASAPPLEFYKDILHPVTEKSKLVIFILPLTSSTFLIRIKSKQQFIILLLYAPTQHGSIHHPFSHKDAGKTMPFAGTWSLVRAKTKSTSSPRNMYVAIKAKAPCTARTSADMPVPAALLTSGTRLERPSQFNPVA
jgi:hypothetical protein